MRLDVIQMTTTMDTKRVLALADQAYADFCAAGREAEQIDLGLAICSSQYRRVHDANRIMFARVPPGSDATRLLDDAERYFIDRGSTLRRLMLSRLASETETSTLLHLLQTRGWCSLQFEVLRLERANLRHHKATRIVSARSAMKLYKPFSTEVAASIEPQLADVSIDRLDDPQYDALVAIEHGRIVARAAVMICGEVGLIEQVDVLENYRGCGLGRAVVGSAIDLCVRAQLRHVMLTVDPANAIAAKLYASLGFSKLGDRIIFAAPYTVS